MYNNPVELTACKSGIYVKGRAGLFLMWAAAHFHVILIILNEVMKSVYLLLRIYTIISSLFMIPYATYYILNTSPDWEGFPAPLLQHRLFIGLPILFFGLLLLSPHRWMKLKILFYSKFFSLIFFSICLFVGGLVGINSYLIHNKHWMLVFFSFTAIMLSICSPLTLWMKRKIGEI